MNKILLLLSVFNLFVCNSSFASTVDHEIKISDNQFFNALLGQGVDRNKNNKIEVSEARAITSLFVSNCGIKELSGLQYFVNLKQLYCNRNEISKLDISHNKFLHYIDCSHNYLTTLNLSSNTLLESVVCNYNKLRFLDVTKNKDLEVLVCGVNPIGNLNISKNPSLVYLDCFANTLEQLDLSNNKKLKYLNCGLNNITVLDLSQNQSLEEGEYNNNFSLKTICIPNSNHLYSSNFIKDSYAEYTICENVHESEMVKKY